MSRNDVEIQLANGHNIIFEVLDQKFNITPHDIHINNVTEKTSDLARIYYNSVDMYNDNFIGQILEITKQYGNPVTVQFWMKLLVPEGNGDLPIEQGDQISIRMAQSRLSAEVLDVSSQEIDSVDSRSLKLEFKNFRGSPKRDFSSTGSIKITKITLAPHNL
ncbi:MAG: hypothetical protein OXT69_09240 [Candidatus Poribacteria bacterium]|nr:hypothetical protein [Candidatus Poribacteria bacterium]